MQSSPFSLRPNVYSPIPCYDWKKSFHPRILTEVEALPEECRQVIMLYDYQDVTYRDLAELLGVSPGTINARLTRARALLRARLSPCRS